MDSGGTAALHRAVRNRCAGAVEALLEGGADPGLRNSRGTSPMHLAIRPTGRGGTGSPLAKSEQVRIVGLLRRFGAPG